MSRTAPGCLWRKAWAPEYRPKMPPASARYRLEPLRKCRRFPGLPFGCWPAPGYPGRSSRGRYRYEQSCCLLAVLPIISFRCGALTRPVEIFREMLHCAHDGHWREPAQCAKRAIPHGLAKILNEVDILDHFLAADDLVDGFRAACRPDPAGRALAAGLDRAEMEGEARLFGEVDGVVEDHDPAMSHHAALGREGFIVERHIEQVFRPIGAQRTADLHRAHGTAGIGAAAVIVDQLAQGQAESPLDQAAVLDIAGELNRHRSARTAHAEIAVNGSAFRKNE